MRFKERLTNFFASSYTNNSKYNSSYLVNLRLLFERNNKLKSTFDKLGNTFRNSKWNDFKVQNIKTSLIQSWLISFLLIVGLALLLLSFFGYTNNNNTFFLPAFMSELWGAFFFTLAQLSNSFSLILIKAGFLILSIKLTIFQFVGLNNDFILNSFKTHASLNNPNTLNLSASKQSNTITLSPNTLYDTDLVELSRSLGQATYALRKLEDSKSVQFLIDSLQKSPQLHIELLLYDILNLNFSETGSWKPRQLYHNVSNYQPSFNFSNKSISLTLNNLNNLSKSNYNNTLLNFNVFNNLNQSKQNRWLLKNSLLSNSISPNFFQFTQAKALVGNSLYSSTGTSTNVWSSSKLSQLSAANELKTLSFFKSNSLSLSNLNNLNVLRTIQNSPNTIENFNLFEESQFWNIKKYFYSTQMKSNLLQLTNLRINNFEVKNSSFSTKSQLQLLLNQQLQSFPLQVSPFYNSNCLNLSSDNSASSFSQDSSSMLLEGYEFDHLKLFNSNFLISLTATKSSNSLTVHNISNVSQNSSEFNTQLRFKF